MDNLAKPDLKLSIGDVLLQLRQQPFKSMSLEEASERTGIHVNTIIAYHRGDEIPTSFHLVKFPVVYEIPIEILEDYCIRTENRKKVTGVI